MADVIHFRSMTTKELRETFLIDNLFQPGKIELTYIDLDRAVIGSAVPTDEPLTLSSDAALKRGVFYRET